MALRVVIIFRMTATIMTLGLDRDMLVAKLPPHGDDFGEPFSGGGTPNNACRHDRDVFCNQLRIEHTDSAFSPIIGQMERAAGLLHDDTPEQKLDKLDALLAQSSTSIQDAALIAEMLSLPNDGRYPALELTPQQRRQKTLEALR